MTTQPAAVTPRTSTTNRKKRRPVRMTRAEAEALLRDFARIALDIVPEDYEPATRRAEEALDALNLDGATAGAVQLAMARGVLSWADATPGTVLRVMTSEGRAAATDALQVSLGALLGAVRESTDLGVRFAALAVEAFAEDVAGGGRVPITGTIAGSPLIADMPTELELCR